MMRVLTVWVSGDPVPQGALVPFRFRRNGKDGIRLVNRGGKRLKQWRDQVASVIADKMTVRGEKCAADRPFECEIEFWIRPPKRRTRRTPHVRPDIDKLTRAVLDSVTQSGLWKDDSQCCYLRASKQYAHPDMKPGVFIKLCWGGDA